MKKSLAKKVTLSILASAVLMSSSVVWAADATNDTVTFSGDSSDWIYGGRTEDGAATNNTVIINGNGSITGGICGGLSGTALLNNGSNQWISKSNKVIIKSGSINCDVYGGYSRYPKASAINNNVTISGGSFSDANKKIYGGYAASGNVNENKVAISGGTFAGGSVYGGYAWANVDVGDEGGSASNNTVTISDGTFGDASNKVSIYGGYTKAGTGDGDASYNIVTISGGSFEGNIEGGSTDGGGNAISNIVTISGGSFTSAIYGGTIKNGKIEDGNVVNYATGNTVNISGNAVLENAKLYGGYVIDNPYYGGAGTNANTLNIGIDEALKNTLDPDGKYGLQVGAWQNNSVKSIAGFDVINFNYINWSNGETVVKTDTLALDDEEGTIVGKVVIGSGTVKNSESMNLIYVTGTKTGEIIVQSGKDITIRTGLTTSETVKGDIVLDGNNIKLTIDDAGIATEGIVAKITDSSTGNNVPAGATTFVDAVDKAGENTVAYKVLDAVYTNYTTDEEQKKAVTNMLQLGEAGGQSATAANISRNVSGATVNRMSFGGRGGVRHRGGHGPVDFNEKDGSAVWAQYVHGKDKVDGMALADGVTTSYESQFNGVVLGVDFKEVGKYQSGIAFNYGEGDSHTKNIAFSRSDYDFWGIGYYGAVKNADSNVIFDINYAKTDSEVKQQFEGGVELEAEPETTTISAGVKVEKLIDKGAMQFVPYAGLRFMSIDTDEYSANYLGKEAFNYSADRQNIWLLPVGVSFRQENVYDSGWVVTPKVDLSYIWAFGDTENEMTVRTSDVTEAARLGYTVMNDGSFLGSIGLEAEKGDWTFGVAYSYQKSSDSRSDRWYVDAKYSF